jgi:hypothetical protein
MTTRYASGVVHAKFVQVMELEDEFQDFLKERSEILRDIEQFLFMTFRYFSKMGNRYDPKSFATETVRSLIQSLCLIHGLYGYPERNSSTKNITGKN